MHDRDGITAAHVHDGAHLRGDVGADFVAFDFQGHRLRLSPGFHDFRDGHVGADMEEARIRKRAASFFMAGDGIRYGVNEFGEQPNSGSNAVILKGEYPWLWERGCE